MGFDIEINKDFINNYELNYVELKAPCQASDSAGSDANKTARGAIINTQDVIEALDSDKIKYLGIDVYEKDKEEYSLMIILVKK